MIIDLSQIQDRPKTYHLHLPEEWWKADLPNDQVQGLYRPVVASLTIERIGKRFIVNGDLNTVLMLQCDRCLQLFPKDLRGKFQLFLEPQTAPVETEEDIELAEDEMSIDLLPAQEVDLENIVKEQVYLSLPMKILCRDDCRGLCPTCGANLNEGLCNCHVRGGHPAFQVLKNLL